MFTASKFLGRTRIIQLPSDRAALACEDHRYDLVFIDAEHTYEAVSADILSWRSLIKPGGYIGGHDYGHEAFPGVKRAVDEWMESLLEARRIAIEMKLTPLPKPELETGADWTWFVRLGA